MKLRKCYFQQKKKSNEPKRRAVVTPKLDSVVNNKIRNKCKNMYSYIAFVRLTLPKATPASTPHTLAGNVCAYVCGENEKSSKFGPKLNRILQAANDKWWSYFHLIVFFCIWFSVVIVAAVVVFVQFVWVAQNYQEKQTATGVEWIKRWKTKLFSRFFRSDQYLLVDTTS